MYGLVNQGIKDLVISRFGEETWLNLCQHANSPSDLVSMQYYEDQITYRLVGSAAKLLQVPPEKILSEFGKFWIQYTAQEGYGPLMDLFGADFKSCLKNLNHLHTRMGLTMPQLKPPSFIFEELSETTFLLKYQSHRKGLNPMVQGLIEGLAAKFGHSIRVFEVSSSEPDFVTFQIEIMGVA